MRSRTSRTIAARSARHRGAYAALIAGVFGALLATGGCQQAREARGATSIFGVFNTAPSPGEAARMSVDPFDPNKRAEGTLLLVNAPWGGEPVYVEHYRVSALDDDAAVRLAGIRGLARHGGPEHVGLLTERLSDEDALVRREAARALQRLHNPEAIDALLDATQAPTDSVLVQQSGDGGEGEPDPEVRAAAAHALGQYAENRVVVSLIASLDDPYLSVNQSTLAALNTLTGQDFGYDRRDWQQWYDATEDIFAARRAYVYPTFQRDRKLIEYLPFIPPPPNEPQASPVGFPVEVGAR